MKNYTIHQTPVSAAGVVEAGAMKVGQIGTILGGGGISPRYVGEVILCAWGIEGNQLVSLTNPEHVWTGKQAFNVQLLERGVSIVLTGGAETR